MTFPLFQVDEINFEMAGKCIGKIIAPFVEFAIEMGNAERAALAPGEYLELSPAGIRHFSLPHTKTS